MYKAKGKYSTELGRFRARKRIYQMTETELSRNFLKTSLYLLLTLTLLLLSATVFGPKIGGLLAFISVHRNDVDKTNQVAPNAPIFSNVPKATNQDSLTLNGFSKAGATVKLFVNGPESLTTTADSDGLFTFVNISLIDGVNTIFAKAVDKNNLESASSEVVNIVKDKKAPTVDITSPKDGDVIKNLDKRVAISGKVDKKATVKINDQVAILNSDLTFQVLLGIEEGKTEIKIVATDEAGNKTEKTINVTYVKTS